MKLNFKKLKTNKLLFSVITGMMAMGAQCANAQGAYINIGSGYGFSTASRFIGYNATRTSSTSYTYTGVYGSYGKGLNFGAAFGYMLNKNVGAELGLNYLIGGLIQTTSTDNISSPPSLQTDAAKVNMLRIIPTVIIAAGEGKIQPYAKIGLVLGLMGKMTYNYSNKYGTNDIKETRESTGGTAIGFSSALGLKIGSGKMSFFGEVAMINQSWAAKKSVLTKSTNNGTDQLATKTTSQKETDFVDNYTISNYSSPPDENVPQQTGKWYLPMSSFGINIGLRIAF